MTDTGHGDAGNQLASLISLSISDSEAFIAQIMGGMVLAGYRFPEAGDKSGDGKLANNCISRHKALDLRKRGTDGSWSLTPETKQPLICAHLNMMVTPNQIRGKTPSLTLKLKLLHMTVRRFKTQKTIDKDGASKLTADSSIHVGPGQDWGRRENLKALSHELSAIDQMPFTEAEIVDYLVNCAKIHGRMMAALPHSLMAMMKYTIGRKLPGVTINIEAGDGTWK